MTILPSVQPIDPNSFSTLILKDVKTVKEKEFADDVQAFKDNREDLTQTLANGIAREVIATFAAQSKETYGCRYLRNNPMQFSYSLDITDPSTAKKLASFIKPGKLLFFSEWCKKFTPEEKSKKVKDIEPTFKPKINLKLFQATTELLYPEVCKKLGALFATYLGTRKGLHLEASVLTSPVRASNFGSLVKDFQDVKTAVIVTAYIDEDVLTEYDAAELAQERRAVQQKQEARFSANKRARLTLGGLAAAVSLAVAAFFFRKQLFG